MSQVRAGAAFVELTLKNSALVKGLRQAQKQLSSFASSTTMLGTKLTGLGVAMAAPLGAGIQKFAEYDDAIRQVALKRPKITVLCSGAFTSSIHVTQ